MSENDASEAKRGGDIVAAEHDSKLESTVRMAVEQFGIRAVNEALSRLQIERQEAAAEIAKQAIIDLIESGGLLTMEVERDIIAQTGVDKRVYKQLLNGLIWRKNENETGVVEFNGYGFAKRVIKEEVAEKFRQRRGSQK